MHHTDRIDARWKRWLYNKTKVVSLSSTPLIYLLLFAAVYQFVVVLKSKHTLNVLQKVYGSRLSEWKQQKVWRKNFRHSGNRYKANVESLRKSLTSYQHVDILEVWGTGDSPAFCATALISRIMGWRPNWIIDNYGLCCVLFLESMLVSKYVCVLWLASVLLTRYYASRR